MRVLFVTATGTGIGKTLVAAALVHQLRAAGRRVRALKPVMTGFVLGDRTAPESDAGVLLAATGEAWTLERLEAMAPFRYAAPLAPSMAAPMEGQALGFDAVVDVCRAAATGPEDELVIEGIGGIMVPLTPSETVLDLIAALGAPALIVTGTYLGSLSHTLSAVEALNARRQRLAGVVVSESVDGGVGLAETVAALRPFLAAPLVALPRLRQPQPWRHAPDLTSLART